MRLFTSRLSVSSCCSPGPRVPMPPTAPAVVAPPAPATLSKWDPHTGEARVGVFELGEFDLEFGLGGFCTGGEDVENQSLRSMTLAGTIASSSLILAREEIVIEYDEVGVESLDSLGELFDLAFADVQGGLIYGFSAGSGQRR